MDDSGNRQKISNNYGWAEIEIFSRKSWQAAAGGGPTPGGCPEAGPEAAAQAAGVVGRESHEKVPYRFPLLFYKLTK